MAVLVIEACRRSLSPWMAVTICVSLVYLATSQWIPGLFNFKGYSFPRMVEFVYLAGDEGMYGFLTGISSNILFIYVLFAAVMMKAGVGEFVIDVAVRLAGWARGGPAKIAVIASALFGTISGSTVANVYATGSFTIPLMKKGGYTAEERGRHRGHRGHRRADHAAGHGRGRLHHVGGHRHLVLRDHQGRRDPGHPLLRRPDGHGALPGPALRHAGRCRARSCPRGGRCCATPTSRSPSASSSTCWPKGYSPTGAAFYTIVVTFVLSFLDRKTWMTPRRCWEALIEASFSAATIAVALAGSGMIVGVLTRTGAALAFGGVVVQAARRHPARRDDPGLPRGVGPRHRHPDHRGLRHLGHGGRGGDGQPRREPARRAPLRLLLRGAVRSHAARRGHRLRRRQHRGRRHVRHRHRGLPARHRGLPRARSPSSTTRSCCSRAAGRRSS